MFWLRNKKNNFLLHTLIWRPGSGDEKGYFYLNYDAKVLHLVYGFLSGIDFCYNMTF